MVKSVKKRIKVDSIPHNGLTIDQKEYVDTIIGSNNILKPQQTTVKPGMSLAQFIVVRSSHPFSPVSLVIKMAGFRSYAGANNQK